MHLDENILVIVWNIVLKDLTPSKIVNWIFLDSNDSGTNVEGTGYCNSRDNVPKEFFRGKGQKKRD